MSNAGTIDNKHVKKRRNWGCLTPEPEITNIITMALTEDVQCRNHREQTLNKRRN